MSGRFWLGLAGAVRIAWCADIDPEALLARVRSKVVADARKIPRYVCRQKIERRTFLPKSTKLMNCAEMSLEVSEDAAAGRRLTTSDRAKLDVMLTDRSELFAWPGGRSFDVDNPGDLLGQGIAGSGDFAGFRLAVFINDRVEIRFEGRCGDSCMRYSYDVPAEVSHYVLKSPTDQATVGYHGAFEVDASTAELLKLSVIPTEMQRVMPGTCAMLTQMNYARAASDAGEFMIPAQTYKILVPSDGSYLYSKVLYEGCRQYSAESTLSFAEDSTASQKAAEVKRSAAIPAPDTELELRLVSKIDSETSSAGDAIEAALTHPVRDAAGGRIPAGTVVSGHLAQVERIYWVREEVMLAIRFNAIMMGGSELPVTLEPVGRRDLRGRGVFVFRGPRIVLGESFRSRWRARAQSAEFK